MDYCPYKFDEIDMRNLAYELVFPEDIQWEDVKEKTVIGILYQEYVEYVSSILCDKDSSGRIKDEAKRGDNKNEHIMLLEQEKDNSVLELFKQMIELLNKSSEDSAGTLPGLVDAESAAGGADAGREVDELEKLLAGIRRSDRTGQERKKLYHKQADDGLDTFVDQEGNLWITAIPCCPNCHKRLPLGWKEAEDFGAVSLMAPTGGGKTTFLYSMMHNNWEVFSDLGGFGGENLYITAAHRRNDPKDVAYADMMERSDEMCRSGGRCPDNTSKTAHIAPVFLNVQYGEHKLIIGIYDNAGENLMNADPAGRPMIAPVVSKMFAELYLFDPEDLNISLPDREKTQALKSLEECAVMPLEEQGPYQEERRGERASAGEILGQYLGAGPSKAGASRMTRAMQPYRNHCENMQHAGCLKHMKEMYFLGILIKGDLLEHVERIRADRDYDLLFDRGKERDLFNMNAMQMRSDLVRQMIREFDLFGDVSLDTFRKDFGEIDADGNSTGREAVSWHLLSALGCDVANRPEGEAAGGTLKGEYVPIRLAEPLISCIVKRIVDNNWVE